MTGSPWLSRTEVAERLGVPVATVKYWARKRTGPPYAKFGIHARYHIESLEAWEREQIVGEAS